MAQVDVHMAATPSRLAATPSSLQQASEPSLLGKVVYCIALQLPVLQTQLLEERQ